MPIAHDTDNQACKGYSAMPYSMNRTTFPKNGKGYSTIFTLRRVSFLSVFEAIFPEYGREKKSRKTKTPAGKGFHRLVSIMYLLCQILFYDKKNFITSNPVACGITGLRHRRTGCLFSNHYSMQ
jgi:hypothetical protein